MSEHADMETFNEVTTAPAAGTTEEAPIVTTQAAPVVETKPVAAQPEADRHVPLAELLAERRTRQETQAELAAMRREIESLRKPPEPAKKTDLFEDPSQFVRQEMDQSLQRDRAAAIYNAKLIAEARFTEEKVNAAQQAFDTAVASGSIHPAEHARVLNSPNPFAEAVKWHQQQSVLSTVGGDLAAYEAKLRAKFLSDPEFRKEADAAWRQQAAGAPAFGSVIKPAVPSLPSLSRVGAAALPSAGEAYVPDDELFKQTVSRKRR